MLRGVMVAALAAGCAEVPEGEGPIEADGISVGPSSLTSETFTLAFAENGIRLPESLIHAGSVEILAENACPEPSRAGVAIAPFQSAYGGHVVPGATSTLEILDAGPAVVRAEVRYDLPYDCAGKQSLQGSTTFTVFPSGRIVRQDAVKPSTTTVSDAFSCTQTCNSAPEDNATFTAFWALAENGERFVPGNTMPATGSVNTPFSCAQYPTHTVGVRWDAVPVIGAARSTEIGGTLVSEYPFLDKRATVAPATETARSTLFVAAGERDCAELEAEMRYPQHLVVNGDQVAIDMFDVYVDTEQRSRLEITPPLGESVPQGFAIRTRIATDHLRVEHGNGERVRFALQPDGDATIIWLDAAIPENGSIILEAL